MKTPVVFIALMKDLLNAFAAKLFISTGAIIIGKEMLKKTSDIGLEAVVAHEIGHINYEHINKNLALALTCLIGSKIGGNGLINYLMDKSRADFATGLEYSEYLGQKENYKFWITLLSLLYGPSFIVNKRFERQADQFACENGKAEGIIEFFSYLKEREALIDNDYLLVSDQISQSKSKVAFSDYLALNVRFMLTKAGHKLDKISRWIYHNTPLGAHPSNEERIQTAQDYIANNGN